MNQYDSHHFKKAIVRPPASNFQQGVTEADLGPPDFEKALQQHAAYCSALEACGLELVKLSPDSVYPDSCFVEDTAIVIDDTAVITRIGHPARRGEEAAVETALARFKHLELIKEPGTVDGGDVMRVGNQFFIGLSKRTNKEGADQLAKIIARCGKSSSTLPVEKFIHLKTFMSGIDAETIIGLIDHIPHQLATMVQNQIIVSDEEEVAANCVSANGFVIIPSNCPTAHAKLQALGKKVIAVDTSEFVKMDGRLTCLSILF